MDELNMNLYFLGIIYDALCDLLPSEQFKKREKNSWRSVKLLHVTLHECFLSILNCTNGTKHAKRLLFSLASLRKRD